MKEEYKKYMDVTVKPGTDFYKYANGHWIDYHKPRPEYPEWDAFGELVERNIRHIGDIIAHGDGSTMSRKITTLYDLSLDWKRRNAEGAGPLVRFIENEIKPIRTREDVFRFCHKFHFCPFFGIEIYEDMKDPDFNAVYLSQGGLSLGLRDYYQKDDDDTKRIVSAFRKYIMSLYGAVHAGHVDRKDKNRVFELLWKTESEMAEKWYSLEECHEPSLNYHPKTMDEIFRETSYNLKTFLEDEGFDGIENVIVMQEDAVYHGWRLLNEMGIDDLKTILEIHMMEYADNKLDDRMSRISFRFDQARNGTKRRQSRKKQAAIMVNGYFGDAIGEIYVRKYFKERDKKDVLGFIHNLIDSYKGIILSKEWLSDETKELAVRKLDGLRIKIGYPDRIDDYSDCPLDSSMSLFDNLLGMRGYFHHKELEKRYNKPVDKDEWLTNPQTVNAYYNPTTNEICFPAGILQAPFYDRSRNAALNYGGIGVVIGHEMTHGYDNHGRQFDADGKLVTWWKDDEIAKFNELTQNTVDRFNSLEALPGVGCNGTLTLGENLADYGGLRIAYDALSRITSDDDDKRLFFISYGLVWAGCATDEYIKEMVLNDSHSIGRMRVNGTLPMFDAWYDAFGITPDDDLYVEPDKRAKIW